MFPILSFQLYYSLWFYNKINQRTNRPQKCRAKNNNLLLSCGLSTRETAALEKPPIYDDLDIEALTISKVAKVSVT